MFQRSAVKLSSGSTLPNRVDLEKLGFDLSRHPLVREEEEMDAVESNDKGVEYSGIEGIGENNRGLGYLVEVEEEEKKEEEKEEEEEGGQINFSCESLSSPQLND